MNAREALAEQTIKLLEVKEENKNLKRRLSEIVSILVRCGGPLNDNLMRFNKTQLTLLNKILAEAEL
jgi:hypothetical protein